MDARPGAVKRGVPREVERDLQQQTELVGDAPVLDELAVLESSDVDRAAGGRSRPIAGRL